MLKCVIIMKENVLVFIYISRVIVFNTTFNNISVISWYLCFKIGKMYYYHEGTCTSIYLYFKNVKENVLSK
jgi:hypothetical protein